MAVDYAVTYHVEAEAAYPSSDLYEEIAQQIVLADELGFGHAWFAEHHGHAHIGHMPHPVLYCIHLAARTKRIHLGAAVVCVNLHHPILIAEQIAILEALSGGRVSVGLGSGSTAAEFALFGAPELPPDQRRARFAEVLDILERAWSGDPFEWCTESFKIKAPALLPKPTRHMPDALWIGANSTDSAAVAGQRGYGLQMSNLRTTEELKELIAAYRAGRAASERRIGPERIAASAPLYVASTDEQALAEFGPALEILVRENRRARPTQTPGSTQRTPRETAESLRFTVGSPERCVDEMLRLREQLGFTTLNVRPRWGGQTPKQVQGSLRLFAERVRPKLDEAWSKG